MTIAIEAEALADAIEYFRLMPEVSAKAASMALNQVSAREGMRMLQDEIEDQVSFPKGYLNDPDKLGIKQYATESNPEVVIKARQRPTSLARFAVGGEINSKDGVTLRVGGSTTSIQKAWLVRLRSGKSLTEDKYNVGLAIRLKPGQTLRNKNTTHQAWLVPGEVALLYGPSVDQVFRDVAGDKAGEIIELVADEFNRQLERLL